ncbi:hypothetical protein [Haloarchaeobius amylolyticus]|uniref:hypothetical protein n=1 Tax=Haloarchaeobius amylolyticus TaxID=1198296 RepID=UPI0022713356|nr:hypothetical protein [Haloarchaeobius amylolyticus]
MAQRYYGRQGTSSTESIDFELDRDTIGQLLTRRPWVVRWVLAEVFLVGLAMTIPLFFTSELAKVAFGMVLAMAVLSGLVGLVAGAVSLGRAARRALRRRRAEV